MKCFAIRRLLTANANDPHHVSRDPNLPHRGLDAGSRREEAYVGGAFFECCPSLARDFCEIAFALGKIDHELLGRPPLEQHVDLTAILRCLFILAEPGDETLVLVAQWNEAVEPLAVAIADLGQSVRQQRDFFDLSPVLTAGCAIDTGGNRLGGGARPKKGAAHPTTW